MNQSGTEYSGVVHKHKTHLSPADKQKASQSQRYNVVPKDKTHTVQGKSTSIYGKKLQMYKMQQVKMQTEKSTCKENDASKVGVMGVWGKDFNINFTCQTEQAETKHSVSYQRNMLVTS